MKSVIWCPGPSLYVAEIKVRKHIDELHIAVNGAVLLCELSNQIIFDYWAFGDAEVFRACVGKMKFSEEYADKLKIWTHQNAIRQSAERLAGWTEETRKLFNCFQAEYYDRISEIVDLGAVKFWRSYTMFCAIALAVLKDSNEIELVGADFGGKGYFTGGLENFRTDHSDKRWKKELGFYLQAKDALARQGIKLQRRGYEI